MKRRLARDLSASACRLVFLVDSRRVTNDDVRDSDHKWHRSVIDAQSWGKQYINLLLELR